MMDKPAIPLSSSSSFQQYHQYIHSSAMQLQPFLRTRPLQLCHGGLQGALRNYHPLWHEPPHQMWQIKHLKKAFFGNKSTKISLEAILTVHITLEKSPSWLQSLRWDSEHRTHVWCQAKVHLESRPKLHGSRRSRHWNDAITVVTEKGARLKHTKSNQKCATNPSINMKNLNQDGKSKGTLHHVLCLPAQHIATITSENFWCFFVSWSGISLVVTSFFHCGFVSPFGLLSATTLGRIQLHIFGGELQLCSIGARLWHVKPESAAHIACQNKNNQNSGLIIFHRSKPPIRYSMVPICYTSPFRHGLRQASLESSGLSQTRKNSAVELGIIL